MHAEHPPTGDVDFAAGGGPKNGELTVNAIIAGVLVAVLMGATYPYMTLKLGFGPNVSVVAAFFGYMLLNGLAFVTRKPYDRWQNNIVQTAGTSAAQTAFMCVLLGAFDLLRAGGKVPFAIELTPTKAFVWLTVACTLGVLMAVPLRQHFIVDEKLTFADGVATAETLVVLDPPANASAALRDKARKAALALMAGVVLSGGLMVAGDAGQVFHLIPEQWVPTAVLSTVVLAKMGVGVAYSVLSVGSGMLIGFRICFSMILGGLLGWVIVPPLLVRAGELPLAPSKTAVLTWVMWPATGMLVAGGLAALFLRWRVLLATFTNLRRASLPHARTVSGEDGAAAPLGSLQDQALAEQDFPIRWVGLGCLILTIALAVIQREMLGMPIWMTLLAVVLSIPLMLVGLRVLGETGWGPISALSNMMQGLFAWVAPQNTVANMVASGTTGTIATSSEAIMQDYKTGHMIGSSPRKMTYMQLLAVPIGAAAVSWVYPVLIKTYGLIDEVDATGKVTKAAQLSSPISKKWAYFAELLHKGFSALPSSALYALLAFAVLGVVLTVAESKPALRKWVPSPTGIGIGILVPFSVISTMFIGAVIALVWFRVSRKTHEEYATPLASGLIAGEAIAAVVLGVYLFLRS